MKILALLLALLGLAFASQAQTNELWLLELNMQNSLRQTKGFLSQYTPEQSQINAKLFSTSSLGLESGFTPEQYNRALSNMVEAQLPKKLDVHPALLLLGAFAFQTAYNSYVLRGNPYTFVTTRYRQQFNLNPDIGLRDFGGYTKPNQIPAQN